MTAMAACAYLWYLCTRVHREAAIILCVMASHSKTDKDPRQQGPDPALMNPTTLLLESSSQLFSFAKLIISQDIFPLHMSKRLSCLELEFTHLQSTRSHPSVCVRVEFAFTLGLLPDSVSSLQFCKDAAMTALTCSRTDRNSAVIFLNHLAVDGDDNEGRTGISYVLLVTVLNTYVTIARLWCHSAT